VNDQDSQGEECVYWLKSLTKQHNMIALHFGCLVVKMFTVVVIGGENRADDPCGLTLKE
jgi:hypothetical protein